MFRNTTDEMKLSAIAVVTAMSLVSPVAAAEGVLCLHPQRHNSIEDELTMRRDHCEIGENQIPREEMNALEKSVKEILAGGEVPTYGEPIEQVRQRASNIKEMFDHYYHQEALDRVEP